MIYDGKNGFEPTMFKSWSRDKFLDQFKGVQNLPSIWEKICKANDIVEVENVAEIGNVRGSQKKTKHPNPFKSE
jgi:uncharacterized membrane protein YqiK